MHRKPLSAFLIALVLLGSSCAFDQTSPREAATAPTGESRAITARDFKVDRIIDGDTFVIFYDGELTSCRIAGINAPELRSPGGEESRQALSRIIAERDDGGVTISFPARRKRDNFGRLLVGVTSGGRDIAEAMIAGGWAVRREIR